MSGRDIEKAGKAGFFGLEQSAEEQSAVSLAGSRLLRADLRFLCWGAVC